MDTDYPDTYINEFRGKYAFLSNFCRSEIWMGDKMYPTVEHFFQAGKAKTVEDHEFIRNACSPSEAKKFGKIIELRDDWEEVKIQYMKLGLILKFGIEELGDMLLATGDAYLEEGNTWGDRFWGTVDGVGENHLGKLLMQVRDELPERREKSTTVISNEKADEATFSIE